jgi:hypothetical protein
MFFITTCFTAGILFFHFSLISAPSVLSLSSLFHQCVVCVFFFSSPIKSYTVVRLSNMSESKISGAPPVLSKTPDEGCRATKEELIGAGKTPWDDCPVCFRYGISCAVGSHPSTAFGSSSHQLFHLNNTFSFCSLLRLYSFHRFISLNYMLWLLHTIS